MQVEVSGSGVPASADFPGAQLIHPENGEINLKDSVTFRWFNCRDREGRTATYRVYTSRDPGFVDERPRLVGKRVLSLGFGAAGVLLLLRLRRRHWHRHPAWLGLLLSAGCLLLACSEDIEDSSTVTVSSLQPKTTYYWKVLAEYEDGLEAPSDTYSFTTR